MSKNVLIVDDNQEMLLTLKEGLDRYQDVFSVMIAGDGRIAMEKLRQHWISLIITDLKMPNINGLDLLAHIKEHYPEIPVVVITGYSTASIEEKLSQAGAAQFIEKPFQIKTLAELIKKMLHQQYDGGTLHNVSPGMFIQLVEMEQKTCTIRVACQHSGGEGVLFFRDGELMEARSEAQRGQKAAYDIFAWDKVDLNIEDTCGIRTRRIEADLQSVLLEALRRKDERECRPAADAAAQSAVQTTGGKDETLVKGVWRKLEGLHAKSHLKEVYQDESWNPLVDCLKQLGESTDAGDLKVAYIHQEQSKDCFLIPENHPIIITAGAKCPRDQIMRTLSV
jgi:CheY-like chemotaxis protein